MQVLASAKVISDILKTKIIITDIAKNTLSFIYSPPPGSLKFFLNPPAFTQQK